MMIFIPPVFLKGNIMKRYKTSMAQRKFAIVWMLSLLLSFVWFSNGQAQTKSVDTTAVKSSHIAKVKPKKIKKRRSVYKLQSLSVAEELGLSGEQTSKLEVIYREMRKSHKLALTKMPKEGDKSETQEAIRQLREKDRAKLAEDLKAVLTDDQIDRALPLLSCFNPQWDSYVNVLSRFDLEKEKMNTVMALVNKCMLELQEPRSKSIMGGNKSGGKSSRKSIVSFDEKQKSHGWQIERVQRQKTQNPKQQLDLKLATLLDPAQYEQWIESTAKDKKKTTKK
jgi:hypothetical protein